jgi:hypothetical protein
MGLERARGINMAYRIVEITTSGYIQRVVYEHLDLTTAGEKIHKLNDTLTDDDIFYGVGYEIQKE